MYQLKKTNFTHEAMVDLIIANPSISRKDLAATFDLHPNYITVITNSDSFREALAARKGEILDPILRQSLEDKIKGAANLALEKIIDRLSTPSAVVATKDLVAIARLSGAQLQAPAPTVQNNTYVMNMPSQANNSQDWLKNRMGQQAPAPRPLPMVDEVPDGKA